MYEYQPGRSGDYPRNFLEGFHGLLQCDCYQGYNKVEDVLFDVEINVIRRRHYYKIYGCRECEKTYRVQIEKRHKEKNQYGSNVQALALSLMVTGNVVINMIQMLL